MAMSCKSNGTCLLFQLCNVANAVSEFAAITECFLENVFTFITARTRPPQCAGLA